MATGVWCSGRCVLTLPKFRPEAQDWPRLWEVTPRWWYWRYERAEWDRAYLAQLNRYGPRRVARRLAEIAREQQADRLVVMCYEPLPADCHRGLFAAWWLTTTGERINEIT